MTKAQVRICVLVPLTLFGGRLAFTIPDVGLREALAWLIDDFLALAAFSVFLIVVLVGETPKRENVQELEEVSSTNWLKFYKAAFRVGMVLVLLVAMGVFCFLLYRMCQQLRASNGGLIELATICGLGVFCAAVGFLFAAIVLYVGLLCAFLIVFPRKISSQVNHDWDLDGMWCFFSGRERPWPCRKDVWDFKDNNGSD